MDVGDTLYIKSRAKLGIFERVFIKKVLLNGRFKIVPIYKDTMNALWNENELVTREEAEALVATA